jgi:hypothetical protein
MNELASVKRRRTSPISASVRKMCLSSWVSEIGTAGNAAMPASVKIIGAVMTYFSSLAEIRLTANSRAMKTGRSIVPC